MDVGKCRGKAGILPASKWLKNIDLQKSGHPDRGHLCNEDAPAQNHYLWIWIWAGTWTSHPWIGTTISYMLPVRPMDWLLIGICRTIESWDLEKKSGGWPKNWCLPITNGQFIMRTWSMYRPTAPWTTRLNAFTKGGSMPSMSNLGSRSPSQDFQVPGRTPQTPQLLGLLGLLGLLTPLAHHWVLWCQFWSLS